MIATTARAVVGAPGVARAGAALAGRLGRGVVLVYHRVLPDVPGGPAPVPTVSVEMLRRHVAALRAVGDIVPCADLLGRRGSRGGPRFALTFDDDAPSHVDHVLPLLEELDAPATFFLSGRSLHGLGGYWWDALGALLAHDEPAHVARRLGIAAADAGALTRAVERDTDLQQRLTSEAGPSALSAAGIARLGQSMDVGFHTLHHPLLSSLAPEQAARALVDGRQPLEDVLGRRIVHFAYPYGKATPALAELAEAGGYRAAFTGRPARVDAGTHPFLVPRWEAGGLDDRTFRARLLKRLLGPGGQGGG